MTLYNLADLVLHHNWLSLLNDKAARSYKDSGLEVFQLLVSCLEFHLDNWIDDQILSREWKETSRHNNNRANLGKRKN